jgi:membrane-associated phospholipid phosphatase
VISHDPFRTLAAGGPGFAATLAARATRQRTSIAEYRHQTTVAWLAFGAAIAVFVLGWLSVGLLAYLVRGNGTVERIDSSVARWGDLHSSAFSENALQLVTLLGNTLVVAVLVALLLAVDWWRRRNARVVLFLLAAVVGVGVITLAIKLLMDRARPTINPITETLGPSFPSGHTSLAAAFFAAAALLLSRGRSKRATALLGGAAVGLAVAVAASRVFLDVHWVTDVIAGLGLGWAWFAFCAIAFGGIPRRLQAL